MRENATYLFGSNFMWVQQDQQWFENYLCIIAKHMQMKTVWALGTYGLNVNKI